MQQPLDLESPFPGMDPYTEARHLWKGIHTQLIGELSTHLLPPLLAPTYYVDVEPSLQVRSNQSLFPDMQVLAVHRSPAQKPSGFALPVAEATMQLTTLYCGCNQNRSFCWSRNSCFDCNRSITSDFLAVGARTGIPSCAIN
ncbi:MAG: DUF4058 family protein [Caldilineaceae bacterium]|nr:DUF4058 family protein [Caldilineaceae bacterium]